jgi:hypothetical protein
MPDLHEFWDPNEWELHVLGLLQDRHGPLNVCKVPARHKGDHGLDYYSLAQEVAYQCYAVQEPCGVADRAEKQKAKITTDINKFCTNKTALQALFGDVRIKRWVLVVPLHDSEQVNSHSTLKGSQVKALGLPYVAVDFEIMIHDLDAFDAASRSARALLRQSVSIPSQPVSAQAIEHWSASSNSLVTTLARKLSKRVGAVDQHALDASVNEAVGWFLERENALENLRVNAPELHETLLGVISRHAARLRFSGPPAEGSAYQILREELEELIVELRASVPNFAFSSAQQIALGTLSEWLMRCPLDFPPYAHAE